MKKKLLLAMFTLLIVLTGCSQATKSNPAAVDKNELVFASTKDIRDINPHLTGGELAAQNMVFESLVMNTPEGVKPKLAEKWEISEDGLTYTFHLRKNIKFSDGEPFNAEAVKKNIDVVVANYEKNAWLNLVQVIDSTKVVDEYTFSLTLKTPYYPTLEELGLTRPFRMISLNVSSTEQQRMASMVMQARDPIYWPSIKTINTRCLVSMRTIGEINRRFSMFVGRSCRITRRFYLLCRTARLISYLARTATC